MATVGHKAQCGRILTGKLGKIGAERLALLRYPYHACGRVLDTGDILQIEQPLHGVDRHVDHRPRWNIVDDDRDTDGVVDRLEMLVKPFLGRLVVIRRHHQHAIGAGLLGMLRQVDRLTGRIRPRARDTGTRPRASAMHHSTTCLCSSWESVGLSPVVPTGTRPLVPSSICRTTRARNAFSSIVPFWNGVTKAVNDPRKLVLVPIIRS